MESEDTCSCTPQDQSEYWESLKSQFEDQSIMLKAKELELREKIAQVESLISEQSTNTCSGELSSEIPRVFPRRPESPERDVNPSVEQTSKCPAGFFQKVMENAKSILTMKCSSVHPSTTASEEPTRETDSSCHCDSETQQSSKSTSSKAVSFETVPQPHISSSEYCLCDKESATKNDTTADSYSQELNNSFCCSVTCSSEASHNDSRKEGYICSSCCLGSSTPSPSKQGSKGASSYNTSTYVSRKACSCNTSRTQAVDKDDKITEALVATARKACSCTTSRTQAVEKDDKLSEALVDTASRDTRMITSPCQICSKRRVKSQSDQQSEAKIAFDTKPPGKTSACQVCLEINRLAKLSDKQVEAQAATATKATKVTISTCRICSERRSQSATKYSDKQMEAQTATSSKQIEAVSATVSRATRITNSSCRICLERRSQSASKATGGQFLTPDKQAEAATAPSNRATRATGRTCHECSDKTIKAGTESKDREKPSFVNLQSCWVNPLQNTAKKPVVRDMMPSKDNVSPNQPGGDVSCTAATCPKKPNVCPDFGDGDEKGGPCRKDTCPDFSGESSGQLPCREDTCPDFSGESSGQLPCKEDTCSYLSGDSTGQLPCREETCPDFGGSKRGCRDDTCPVVASITKSVTAPNVSFGKRTEKRKSTCSIGTCPSAKKVRSRSNIRDMDNQCAFIGSPVLNSSNFKGFGDTKSNAIDCCCCTDKEEPSPNTTNTEKCMKCHMQELLEREKNYDSVFQTFQNMANQPTHCCMAAAEKNNAQGDVRRITDELRLENQILKSELMELKYEMKQCLEKVEGPMKQKLQTEKCKCAKLQQELDKTSENMMASQDTYMREMNALKLQLCVACSNMTDLNTINKRLKEEMKSLDCMCSKLEDDLVKQKLNEADTIRMLTKRGSGFGDTNSPAGGTKPAQTCTPRTPKKPQEIQSETFKCDSNLHVIARKLSKTLKESAPCEECSKLPELTGAAKLIKDLTDLVESRKIERSSLDSMASRRDCACQSPPRTEDESCQCNNFRDVGAGEFPVRAGVEDSEASKDEGGASKPTETLFSVSPTFAEKNESSHFGMKPTTPSVGTPAIGKGPSVVESRYYSAHSAPCPMVCDDKAPCAPIQRPCLVSKSETSPDREAKIRSDQMPGKVTMESGTEPCPEICGDSAPCDSIGKPCASSKKEIDKDLPPERVLKETGTEPCPGVCADSAPCAVIGKPCTYPKEEKEGVGDKAPEEVTEVVPAETTSIEKEQEQPSPPGVEPPAEPRVMETPEGPTPCPQVCGDTAPCFSFGRPCQIPAITLPEGLEEAIKRASITSTEEAVRYITGILLKNVLPAESKEKTLAPVELKDLEVLSKERPSISSAEDAVSCLTDILLKDVVPAEMVETLGAVVGSKDPDLPPEGIADEAPIEGTAEVPEKGVTEPVEAEPLVEDLAKDEPIMKKEFEDVLEQETEIITPLEVSSEKAVEKLPTDLSEDEPKEPAQKEIPEPELKEAVEEAPTDDLAAEGKPEEVAETVIQEIVPIESKTNLVAQVAEKPTSDLVGGKRSAQVSNASSQAGPGEEVLLEEVILDSEMGMKPSAVSGDKPIGVSAEMVDKITQSAEKKLFEETIIGDLPFAVETQAVVLEEPPSGLHVTTTVTASGTLEVITEGPAGLIETALTYKEDGTIEVVTQITELSQEALAIGDTSSGATEVVQEKKRSSKVAGGSTPSPDTIAKFDEEKRQLIQEAKQKDSLLSGDSELTGLETVSDYTKDTTAMSSTGKSSATEQLPKDKGTDAFKTDTVTQQTSQVPTYTKSTGGEIPEEAATFTDEKPRRESEVVSPTTTGDVAVSSHVVSSEKATAEATEKSEITVRTSPITTKDTATASPTTTETSPQQTSTIETVGRSTESEPGVSESTTQDTSGEGDGETEDTSGKPVPQVFKPVREITEESTSGGTESESLTTPVEKEAIISSGQPSERGEPVSKLQQDEGKTPSKSWQTEESDERTNVSDIAEDAPYKPVKQATIRQKRDCACQSSTPAEQSCQCCDCKDVGVSTSKDNETNTETKMTIQKLPVKNNVADGEPNSASNDVYETAEGTQSSRVGDTAEANSLDTGKTQGTADEMSTLNEESQLDTKYSDAQDKSSAQKEGLIASGERREPEKPPCVAECSQTLPIQRETPSEPSESYKSAQEIEASLTRDTAKGKPSSGSESEGEKTKTKSTAPYSTPDKRKTPSDSESENERKRKSLEKAEAKRKSSSEVPDSVSKLSDKDNPPLLSNSEGKRQKKKRSSKLDHSSCDCPGVCQCVVCSPEIIAKRKAMTGTADPPDRQSEKLCCCTYPRPVQTTQAVYMQVPCPPEQEPTNHQPRCTCCVPPRTEAFLRSTNLAVNQGALPKDRRRISIDDVFQPAEDPIDQRREAPSGKIPHARSCECIDCLCLPKIQKIAQMREFPVVKDEKQIFQVSSMKCECINAINAKKLALERSRIPIATNSNASPPKVRAPTPAACTCDECRCSPCGDQAKGKPAAQVNQVVSQLGGGMPPSQLGGGMTPSQLAKLCDCQKCDCSICFNKPAPMQETKSKSAAPETCDEPKQTKSTTPAPSVRIRTKNCCCKGECTCELCPVDDDKAKEAPSKMSKKESEKLVKASSLTRPEDCDCEKCVCPMTDVGAESTPQDTSAAPQDTPAAPQEPPHSEDCDCVVCACPNAPAPLPVSASKMSKTQSKSKPPAETQPGADEKPPDCDCETCKCPATGASNAQGDQAEECTCSPCLCPGAATMKPSMLQPIQETVPMAECDCTVCECSPCADPKKRKPAAPASGQPAPCDCPKCECQPCADPSKRSEPSAPTEICVGDVKAASKDKRDTEHPRGCTCDVCECPGKDKVKGKGDEKQVEAPEKQVEAAAELPVCDSKSKAPEPHPDDCICTECLCSEEANLPVKVPHPDNCACPECLCLEEVMVTASDFSQGVGINATVELKTTETGTHPKECTCAECKCPEDATQTEGKLQHGDGCKCPECQCVECYGTVDRFAHALECQCGDCLCTDCSKIRQGGTTTKDVKSVQGKLSKYNATVSFIDKPQETLSKCTCANESICGDCFFSQNIKEYKECQCGVCLCQDCEYMAAGAKSVAKPPAAEVKSIAPATTAVAPSGSCHCIDCQCDICTKEKTKEVTKPAEVVKTEGHPETCTCLACMCIECFDKSRAGAGDKSSGPGIPAAASAGPTSAGKRNPNCKCVDCVCIDCCTEGSTQSPTLNTQMQCSCGDCTCVECAYKTTPQTQPSGSPAQPSGSPAQPSDTQAQPSDSPDQPCDSPEKTQGDKSLPDAEKKTVDKTFVDPPPFETPLRKPCDCVTCPCVICSDKRKAAAVTAAAQPAGQTSTVPPAEGEAPPFEVPVRIPCNCPECSCPGGNKDQGALSTDQKNVSGPAMAGVSSPATAEAPFFEVPIRLPCACAICTCPSCNKEGGKPQIPQDGDPMLVQNETVPLQSAPTVSVSQKETIPDRPSSAPGGARPVSRIHCECPTCVCPENVLDFQTGRMSGKQSTEMGQVSGQPSHMSGKPSNMSRNPPVSAQQSHISGKQSQPGGPSPPVHCECQSCQCPNFQTGQIPSPPQQPSQISGQQSHMSGKPSNVSRNPQVSAQTSHISGKQSQPGGPSSPPVQCECQSCQCPNFPAGQLPSPPQQQSQVSCQPSHVSGKQSTQISFAPSVSSQKPSTLVAVVAQSSNMSAKPSAQTAGDPCAQVAAQTSHVSGQQCTPVAAQTSHISGQRSTQVTAQTSHISGQQSTPVAAQTSHISGKQSTQVTAQSSHISGKPSTQATAKIPDCDCPACVCSPCPDVRISQPQQQAKIETDNTETHPDSCICPACCACDARMAAIDLTRLNDEALEKKIQKDKKENCECREQIKEIRKALTKIKCACTEAELKAMKSKPLVKQASTFGQTMSGLKLALTNLQEKCKAKDKMIDAMTGELKQRTSSKTFDKVLNKSNSEAPDYDKAGDVKSSDPSHEVISTNVLYTVEEERDTAAKSTFDAKLSRAMETEKKKKKSSKSCRCGKSHKSKDSQNVDLNGFEIVDIRRITQDSIIIKWKPPRGNSITGYDIYINGVNKSKVMSGGRTSAMIHSLDLSATIQVTIYAVTKCGRCEPPAIAIYEVRP